MKRTKNTTATIKPGMNLYSIATGRIDPRRKDSRDAVDLIASQPGFLAIHPSEKGTLWFFDSLNNAKLARNVLKSEGAEVGNNICRFEVDENGIPDCKEVC